MWLLSRYSRKFIFIRPSLPKSDALVAHSVLFEKKHAWRWVFRNEDSAGPKYKRKVKKEMAWPDAQVAP